MPTPLRGQTPGSTYQKLLVIDNSTSSSSGLDSSLRAVLDGSGAQTPLQLSMNAVALNGLIWPATGNVSGAVLRVSVINNVLEWHTITSTDITNALGFMPANSNSGSFSSSLSVKSATIDTAVTTVAGSQTATVYTFTNSTGGTIKVMCQVKDTVTHALHAEELLVVTDGSIVDATGFGVVYTQASLGTFDASMSGSSVNVTFSSSSPNTTTVTVVATSVTS